MEWMLNMRMMLTLLQGMFPLNSKIELLWDRRCLLLNRNVYKYLVNVKSIINVSFIAINVFFIVVSIYLVKETIFTRFTQMFTFIQNIYSVWSKRLLGHEWNIIFGTGLSGNSKHLPFLSRLFHETFTQNIRSFL